MNELNDNQDLAHTLQAVRIFCYSGACYYFTLSVSTLLASNNEIVLVQNLTALLRAHPYHITILCLGLFIVCTMFAIWWLRMKVRDLQEALIALNIRMLSGSRLAPNLLQRTRFPATMPSHLVKEVRPCPNAVQQCSTARVSLSCSPCTSTEPTNKSETADLDKLVQILEDPRWILISQPHPDLRMYDLPNGQAVTPFKAVVTFSCPVIKVADLIWSSDYHTKKKISPDILELCVIKGDEHLKVEYQRLDTPRFVSNRDMLTEKRRFVLPGGGFAFTILSIDPSEIQEHLRDSALAHVIKHPSCVRAQLQAYWRVVPHPENPHTQCHIEFSVAIDLGGSIPKRIINAYKTVEPIRYIETVQEFLKVN